MLLSAPLKNPRFLPQRTLTRPGHLIVRRSSAWDELEGPGHGKREGSGGRDANWGDDYPSSRPKSDSSSAKKPAYLTPEELSRTGGAQGGSEPPSPVAEPQWGTSLYQTPIPEPSAPPMPLEMERELYGSASAPPPHAQKYPGNSPAPHAASARSPMMEWGPSLISKEDKDRIITENLRAQGKLPPKSEAPGAVFPVNVIEPPRTLKPALTRSFIFKALLSVGFTAWLGGVMYFNKGISAGTAWFLCLLGPVLLSLWTLVGFVKVELFHEDQARSSLGFSPSADAFYAGATPKRGAPGAAILRGVRVIRRSLPLLILNATLVLVQASILGLVPIASVPLLSLASITIVNVAYAIILHSEISLQTANVRAKQEAVQNVVF